MASKAPPIPPEQRTGRDKPELQDNKSGRRDAHTGVQSGQPGDADVNLKEQGRFGNINQNTRNQGYQQDR